MHQINFCTSNL